jgi:hypothetical protein
MHQCDAGHAPFQKKMNRAMLGTGAAHETKHLKFGTLDRESLSGQPNKPLGLAVIWFQNPP